LYLPNGMILGSLLSVIATPPGRRDRADAAPIAGLADNTPGRTPRRDVGRRQASHLDKQVEPGIGPMEKVPRTRLQIGEPQHASKTNAPALEHALPAQRRGGLGEPPPDLVVHDRAEQNMPPPAAIERLTAAITDVARIGVAHRAFPTTQTNARWSFRVMSYPTFHRALPQPSNAQPRRVSAQLPVR